MRSLKVAAFEVGSMLFLVIALVIFFCFAIDYKLRQPVPADQVAEEYQSDSSLGIESIDGKLTARSSKWRTVRDEFIRQHPFCAACGTKKNLNAHHIKPYHEHPELELEPGNLIALCRYHHFYIGHDPDGPDGPEQPNWSKSNPNVVRDAKKARRK